MAKPELAILIGKALAKKGKMRSDEAESKKEHESESEDLDMHLQDIADDMMKAIHSKDSEALKDLLKEAFECMELAPHEEGEHLDSDEDDDY